jgi:hypothetical protein
MIFLSEKKKPHTKNNATLLDLHMTVTPPYPIEGGFFTMIF